MSNRLIGKYYVEQKLLVVTGGVFTLTIRRVSSGHREMALRRFNLSARDNWMVEGPGILRSSVSCIRPTT